MSIYACDICSRLFYVEIESEECNHVLTCLSPCYDETELLFALFPVLELHPCYCTTAKYL